jgi:hypothetical protein
MQMIYVPHSKHTYGVTTIFYGDSFTFLFVDDVRTSQETPTCHHGLLWGYLHFLYADDIRTSQGTHQWVTAASYGDVFTFL